MYHQFNIQQFYVLPTQCIYVFCVDLRTNSDYFPIQHELTGFYNPDGVCLLRGTDWGFNSCCYPWPRLLVPGFSPQKLGFDPSSIHVIFVLNTVTPGQGFLPVLLLSPVSIIPPMLHIHLHLQVVVTRRTNGRILGTFHKAALFRKSRSIG
jgi:hypothetical protein